MNKKSIIDAVQRFRQGMEAHGIRPLMIILYGSHATGTSGRGSDIDLVVVSNDFIGKDFWERMDILADVIYEIFLPLEVTALTQEEWEQGESWVSDLAREGEVLFAA